MTDGTPDRVHLAEQALGTVFRDPGLLQLALVHSSLLNEPGTEKEPEFYESNERLEFLGDAVLDLLVADYLYRRFPSVPEGRLTVMRATLVRRETLASWATGLGLGALLYVGRGEIQDGVISERTLAGAFEAVIGALYLDQGYEPARVVVDAMLQTDADRLLAASDLTNYKGMLQEAIQQVDTELPEYVVMLETGPDHDRTFVIEARHHGEAIGRGEGRSKRIAEQAAAQDALETASWKHGEPSLDSETDSTNTAAQEAEIATR